jgi:putative protease
MKKQIEILAPAGSYEGMKAAMNAGCDAVYIGGSSFGARAYANNLEESALLEAIDEAHIRGKHLYLTVNTLLKEKEHSKQLYSYLEKFYLQGLDAVIVQDVGVLHFIHEQFPKLPIHASTQMTLTMAEGANLLKPYGVTRLVTSRELSLNEIKKIRDNTDLEIETFVHGALCYCYSGQCLMSSMIGGRSGNRGRCAQPCRMTYRFFDDTTKQSGGQERYLLSPKDINTLTIIPELVEAGIDSFKIEGRMKRPEYAAAVARLYRKYVDYYQDKGKAAYETMIKGEMFREDMLQLQDVYNRGGFSEGYAKTYHGKSMMSLNRPNHSGVCVGEVMEIQGSQMGILLKEKVNAQDILEIRADQEAVYEFTVKDYHEPGQILKTNVGKRPNSSEDKKVPKVKHSKAAAPQVRKGLMVYRTKNNALLDELSKDYIENNIQRGVKGTLKARIGEKLALTLQCQDSEVTVYHEEVQPALKQPMTTEKLAAALEKTGGTLFFFENLKIEADDSIFVPVAWLNEIRRTAISRLQEVIAENYRRNNEKVTSVANKSIADLSKDYVSRYDSNDNTESNGFGFTVSVQTEAQFEATICRNEVTAINVDYDCFEIDEIEPLAKRANQKGKKFYLTLPHICRANIYRKLVQDLGQIIKLTEFTGFVIKNLEEIALLKSLLTEEMTKKQIILNYNMYTYNKEAKLFWQDHQLEHFTAPVELNYQELKELGIRDSDMVVYGYLPLMVSAQCLFENTSACAKGKVDVVRLSKNNIQGRLTDRLDKSFYVKTSCTGCYNTIYNGQPLALYKQAEDIIKLKPRAIRIDFTKESYEEAKRILQLFSDRFYHGKMNVEELTDYTTGHFKRGII